MIGMLLISILMVTQLLKGRHEKDVKGLVDLDYILNCLDFMLIRKEVHLGFWMVEILALGCPLRQSCIGRETKRLGGL